jgi:hypothetical protein
MIGIEMLNSSTLGDAMFAITDCTDVKIRCMGMIDAKTTINYSDFEYLFQILGYCDNVDIARIWFSNSASNYGLIETTNQCKTVLVQNCSSQYSGNIQPRGINNTQYRGVHGGSGSIGGTGGIGYNYSSCYGWAFHDGFKSDTVGFIACIMINESTETNSSYTVISGDPKLYKTGDLYMVSGDVIEFTQNYFTKGHTGFNGNYTASCNTAAWHSNEWGNVTVEFQYDVGSGWNGSWLNARTSTNWTGITVTPSTGVKLKYKFTATGTQNDMGAFIIDTTTTISSQKANYYPIDQTGCDVILNGIVVGSRYWIYNSDTSEELAEGTSAADPVTEAILAPDASNLLIRVRKSSASVKYYPFTTTAITNTTEINVAIIQTADGIVT